MNSGERGRKTAARTGIMMLMMDIGDDALVWCRAGRGLLKSEMWSVEGNVVQMVKRSSCVGSVECRVQCREAGLTRAGDRRLAGVDPHFAPMWFGSNPLLVALERRPDFYWLDAQYSRAIHVRFCVELQVKTSESEERLSLTNSPSEGHLLASKNNRDAVLTTLDDSGHRP